jgi:hypothetical protein
MPVTVVDEIVHTVPLIEQPPLTVGVMKKLRIESKWSMKVESIFMFPEAWSGAEGGIIYPSVHRLVRPETWNNSCHRKT